MGVVIGQLAAGIAKLVAPHAIAQIHAPQDVSFRKISEQSPYRGFVACSRRQAGHDLLMGHRRCLIVQHHEYLKTLVRDPQACRTQEVSDLTANGRFLGTRRLRRLPIGAVVA
jgi:hypothetical protein